MKSVLLRDTMEKKDRIVFDFYNDEDISIETLCDGVISDIRITRKQFERLITIYMTEIKK